MAHTVVIADDHPLTVTGTRAAIATVLEFEIVGTAANGIEAIAVIKKFKPDCAVIDLSMPGANGIEVAIESRRWSPLTRIAIVTGIPSVSLRRQALEVGVDAVFAKSLPVEELCRGLLAVAAGRKIHASDAETTLPGLSPREVETLHAIARGLSNAQIGERLGVSAKTVDSHRTSLMRKFGVHSTATLLVKAMRDGLIDI